MKSPGENISLIGYRGAGKTTVGRLLADRLGFSCVDTDDVIQQRTGRSVAELFLQRGEPAFRDLESEVIAELSSTPRLVLSLGGGAVLREENRRRIRACGPVVWLRAQVPTLAERLARDASTASQRPDLTGVGGRDEIETVLRQRWPLYESVASVWVDTDDCSPQEVVARILDLCGLECR